MESDTASILGFQNLKDLLDVVLVPVVLVIVGVWLPRLFEREKAARMKSAFVQLIRRETAEMSPWEPSSDAENAVWPDYLQKRFIHEKIFRDAAKNRDFILTLDPQLAYHEAQMWTHFDKAEALARAARDEAKKAGDGGDELPSGVKTRIAEHGIRWCHYLGNVRTDLKRITGVDLPEDPDYPEGLEAAWKDVLKTLHPKEWEEHETARAQRERQRKA